MIPQPVQVVSSDDVFAITPQTAVLFEEGTPGLEALARELADVLAPDAGQRLRVAESVEETPSPQSILLSTCAPTQALDDEGYELNVTPGSVHIRAPQRAGVLYAIQTVRQLLREAGNGGRASIRCVKVVDKARFAWRGLMLDCARHFMPVDVIKRTIDLMAFHKLNRFHWHLTDDQGWRLEVRSHPALTNVGAWRGEKNYGGFYSQEDVREVVDHAARRCVTVVPEIDVPGHSMAALASHPELSCQGRPVRVPESWGIFKDIFCAGADGTFALLEDVLSEVCELFPSPWIHLGGDEVPTDRWRACKKCRARMRAAKIERERELQGWFTQRLARFLATNNRRVIGWDETIEAGLVPGAVVQVWRNTDAIRAATALGHQVIVSPSSHCNLDLPVGKLGVEQAYAFEPVPAGLPPGEGRYVLGGEAVLWTESVEPEQVDGILLPRLSALAEVFWSPAGRREFADFQRRLVG